MTRTYDNILNDVVGLIKESESDNLVRYWKFGQLVAEFCKGADRSIYGAKTIQTLAEDLQAKGVLSEIRDPTRHLYWAKSIHDTYKLPVLKEMCGSGYTVYHAKILLALDPEAREALAAEMTQADGKLVSGRQLQDIVKEKYRQKITDDLQAAVATPAEIIEQKTETVDKPAPQSAEVYSSATDPDVPESEGGPSAAEREKLLATKNEKPSKSPKPKDDKKASEPSESPLKVLNQLDKTTIKLMALIPDALIAIRAAGKRGFDSDKAAANYAAKLKDAQTGLASLQEPIQKLLDIIKDEAGSA